MKYTIKYKPLKRGGRNMARIERLFLSTGGCISLGLLAAQQASAGWAGQPTASSQHPQNGNRT
jgi:hypothetical protein